MNIYPYTEEREAAKAKWREYSKAARESNDKVYSDLAKTYNQLKCGRKVIDIQKVISAGGIHENFHPKLAICKVTTKDVFCFYNDSGRVRFVNRPNSYALTKKEDIEIHNCLPAIPRTLFKETWQHDISLKAPRPLIPPSLLPKKLTDDYYVLWEVDKWENIPPVDPYLLRRITPNMFVVVAGWDLTPLERAVMKGRMW